MATGRIPGTTNIQTLRWSKAPTAGTTTLSGADDNAVGLAYTPGYETVYLNGVLLVRGSDYTATDGTTVVLTTATVSGDIVNIFGTQVTSVTGMIPKSIVTAKGDLVAASSSGTPVNLAVGTNGQVLTADSTAATGLAWATSASAFDPLLNQEYSGYYVRPATNAALGIVTILEDVTWYIPIFLSSQSFDRIGCRTASGFIGNATVRLGLYNASTTTGKPTTVVFDAGTVNCTASSTSYEITISQTVTAGWYYLAFNCQTVAGTNEFSSLSAPTNVSMTGVLPMYSTLASGTPNHFFSQTGVTGAFATAGTLVAPDTRAPLVGLRIV